MRKFTLSISFAMLLLIFILGNAHAQVGTYVIGGDEHPWSGSGSLYQLDDQSKPGWIQPTKTSRETNILNALYAQGRLYGSKTPTKPQYTPQDGRIWTPNAPFMENLQLAEMIADEKQDTLSFEYFNRPGKTYLGASIYIDLGAAFPVDEISFYPLCREKLPARVQQELGPESLARHEDLYMKGYALYANDGRPQTQDQWGNPIWTLLDQVPTNFDRLVVNRSFRPQHIQHIRLRCLTNDPFEIDQIEVRGEGYLRQGKFTSGIIDLTDIANFGRILWGAEEESGSLVSVYTRSGRDKTTKIYYMVNDIGELEPLTKDTDENNQKEWDKLPQDARGPIVDDSENWTAWSPAYDSSGQEIVALGPRQFFRVEVVLESEKATNRALLDSLSIEYSQPTMGRSLWGEIDPSANVDLGENYLFRYRVVPDIGQNDIGFDYLEIRTPIEASIEEVKVRNTVIPPEEYVQEYLQERKMLTLRLLNNRRIATSEDVLEVGFDCAILAFGTVFEGMTRATWEEGLLGQRIEVHRIEDLSVRGSIESLGQVLGGVETSPNPFTPNEDGKNDTVTISFKLFQMIGTGPLQVTIYDLSGNLVRTLLSGETPSGIYKEQWDGKNQDNKLVPPGVYVYQIRLEGDAAQFTKNGTVTVVY